MKNDFESGVRYACTLLAQEWENEYRRGYLRGLDNGTDPVGAALKYGPRIPMQIIAEARQRVEGGTDANA